MIRLNRFGESTTSWNVCIFRDTCEIVVAFGLVFGVPTAFVDADSASVLMVSCNGKECRVLLDSLVIGKAFRTLLFGVFEMELTAMDFGRPVSLACEEADILFGNLFAETVCDVEILGVHELSGGDALQVLCGSADVFATSLPLHQPPVDAAFIMGCGEDDPTINLLTLGVFEKNRLVGSATLDLRDMLHVKSSVKECPPTVFAPLMRMGERHGWIEMRVRVSLKTDESLSALRGHVSSAIPFGVDYGDVVLMRTRSALARLISTTSGCKWDHVALVTCNTRGSGLMLMEATSDGVGAYPFDDRVSAILRTVTF